MDPNVFSGIVNGSSRATEGYFNAMATRDRLDNENYDRQQTETRNAYVKSRDIETDKRVHFERAAQIVGGNPANVQLGIEYLRMAGMGEPDPKVGEMLVEYGARMQGVDDMSLQLERVVYPDGTEGFIQASRAGPPRPAVLPNGARPAPQVSYFNAGNQGIPITRSGVDPGLPAIPISPRPQDMPDFKAAGAEAVARAQDAVRLRTESVDPAAQADLEARRLANIKADADAKKAESQMAVAIAAKDDAKNLIEEILAMDISNAYGSLESRLPTTRQNTANVESAINRLGNLLTLENLGKMSGVLTDRDIQILALAASEIQNFRIDEGRAARELNRIKAILEKASANKAGSESRNAAAPRDYEAEYNVR